MLNNYEIETILEGKEVKTVSLGGSFTTIFFTDGSRLELEAIETMPDSPYYGSDPYPTISATFIPGEKSMEP